MAPGAAVVLVPAVEEHTGIVVAAATALVTFLSMALLVAAKWCNKLNKMVDPIRSFLVLLSVPASSSCFHALLFILILRHHGLGGVIFDRVLTFCLPPVLAEVVRAVMARLARAGA